MIVSIVNTMLKRVTRRRGRRGRSVVAARTRTRPNVESLESLCLLAPVTLGPFVATFSEQLIDNIPREMSLPQFDPSLGQLLEVRILVSDQLFGRFAVENLSNTSDENVVASISGLNGMTGPGLQGFTPSNLTASETLPPLAPQQELFPTDPLFCGPDSARVGVTPPPPFLPPDIPLEPCEDGDGTIIIDAPLEASEGFQATLTSTADLAAFLGSGTISYTFVSSGEALITGSTANLITLTLLSSAAQVQVEYTYEPTVEIVCVEADVHIVGVHHQPTQVVFTFDRPVDPVAAADPANYFLARLAPNGSIQRVIPFSVAYDPTANTVVLTPNPPLLPLGADYLVQISRVVAGPGPNDGFVNPNGEDLPCVDFERIIRRGTHLHFNDVDGDGVTLGVSHGGLLELHRTTDGRIHTVKIRSIHPPPRNLQPPHSIFRGSVTRRPQGDGQVTIGRLIGTSQVQNQLPRPPFQVLREIPDAPRLPAAQSGPLYQPLLRDRLLALWVRRPS